MTDQPTDIHRNTVTVKHNGQLRTIRIRKVKWPTPKK